MARFASRTVGAPAALNRVGRHADASDMRRLVVLVVAVILVGLGFATAPASAQTDPPTAESQFIEKINALRASRGLSQLEVHPELLALGRSWAGQMAKADRISHNPNLANSVKANWQKLGENVGVGMTVDKLHQAFIDSPTHFKNLADPDWTHIGVGVVLGRDGAIFTSHQFMDLRVSAPTAPPTTAAPRPSTTRPPATTSPPPTDPPTTTSPPTTAPPRAAAPPPRLVLVLERLAAFDAGGV